MYDKRCSRPKQALSVDTRFRKSSPSSEVNCPCSSDCTPRSLCTSCHRSRESQQDKGRRTFSGRCSSSAARPDRGRMLLCSSTLRPCKRNIVLISRLRPELCILRRIFPCSGPSSFGDRKKPFRSSDKRPRSTTASEGPSLRTSCTRFLPITLGTKECTPSL